MYSFWADVILVAHFAIVAYVVLGFVAIWLGFLARQAWVRNFTFRATHLLIMGVVAFQSAIGVACPLTVWEGDLRQLANQGRPYEESFVEHWLSEVIFIDEINFVLAYCLFFGALVASMIFVRPNWPWMSARSPATPPAQESLAHSPESHVPPTDSAMTPRKETPE